MKRMHDSKLKLVAEGTLVSSDGTSNQYRLSQAVKPNTNYFISAYCAGMGVLASCIITCDENQQGYSVGIWWDDNDTSISITYYLGITTLTLSKLYGDNDLYASEYDVIKIYELPFGL